MISYEMYAYFKYSIGSLDLTENRAIKFFEFVGGFVEFKVAEVGLCS